MKSPRLLWREGQFLGPHHFQQFADFNEEHVQRRESILSIYNWGVASVEFDASALSNGRIALLRLSAIMPDGTLVSLPAQQDVPPSRQLPVDEPIEELSLYLALPVTSSGASNTRLSGEAGSDAKRYYEEVITLRDQLDPSSREQVSVARLNFRLGWETDDNVEEIRLPIGVLKRNVAGAFELDDAFIPPLLALDASPRLRQMLVQATSAVSKQVSDLSKEHQSRLGQRAFSHQDIVGLLFFQTLVGHLPRLRHLTALGKVPPYLLFEELSAICGALTTYDKASRHRADKFPLYDHEQLGHCFETLYAILKDLLEFDPESNAREIPLVKRGRSRWECRLDVEMVSRCNYVLAVKGRDRLEGVPTSEWLPRHAVISSSDRLMSLVNGALAGAPFHHMARPPMVIRQEAEAYYFLLEQDSQEWAHIKSKKSIGIFVPILDSGLSMTLLVIERDGRGHG